MLIAAVLAFASGLYLEALWPVGPLCPAAASVLGLTVSLLLFRRWRRTASALLIVTFFFAGMLRLSFLMPEGTPPPLTNPSVFSGTVTDTTASAAVIGLSRPPEAAREKALLRSQEPLRIGDEVTVLGTARDLIINFKNPHTVSWRWVKKLEGVSLDLRGTVLSRKPSRSFIGRWRDYLRERIEGSQAPAGAIIKALTIGDTTGIDDATKDLFLRTGTSHILAISGSNVAIVCAFFFFFGRLVIGRLYRLRLRGDDSRYAALATIPFAFLFMFLAGAGIPLIRATIMVTVFMLALFFERQRDLTATTFVSGLIILLIYPHSLFTPSFQLTFVSVLFIVLFTERVRPLFARLNRALVWFFSLTGITVAATLGTLPVVLYHFYGFNPLSVLHNLIAVPLMCVVAMPLAVVGLAAPYGEILILASGYLIQFTTNLLSRLNFGYLYPVVRPVLAEILLYYGVIASVIYLKNRLVRAALIFALVPLVIVQSAVVWHERFGASDLCISLIDVGLGESILVEAPKGLRMLIDGGGFYGSDFDTGKTVIMPVLLAKKIASLDYVVSTHPHGDHAGGLMTVMKDLPVGRLVIGAYLPREERFLGLLQRAAERKIPVERWSRGNSFRLTGGAAVEVLSPDPRLSYENTNDASLVMRLRLGSSAFLLTGDVGETVEQQMVGDGAPLHAQVLKVPHHGSRYSSSPAFIEAVSPAMALLSVGRGIPGLPSHEALMRYRLLGIPLLRTDRDGMVRVCTTGEQITYDTYTGRHKH